MRGIVSNDHRCNCDAVPRHLVQLREDVVNVGRVRARTAIRFGAVAREYGQA